MTTTSNLPGAVNAAADGVERLAGDMLDLADLVSMAFGLPRPEVPRAASAGRLPGAVEKLAGSLELVASTCAAASGKLDAVTWRPRDPEQLDRMEAPCPPPEEDLANLEYELSLDRMNGATPDPDREEQDRDWRTSDFAGADLEPEATATFTRIGPDGCLDGPADLPPAPTQEKAAPRPRSRRSRPKKAKKKSH